MEAVPQRLPHDRHVPRDRYLISFQRNQKSAFTEMGPACGGFLSKGKCEYDCCVRDQHPPPPGGGDAAEGLCPALPGVFEMIAFLLSKYFPFQESIF